MFNPLIFLISEVIDVIYIHLIIVQSVFYIYRSVLNVT